MARVSIPGGTRNAEQYHFVRKGDLTSLLSTLNNHVITTLGSCVDVVRNTMCCPAPRTQAYYQLWLDGERAVTAEAPDDEPIYAATYLPRKFKIGLSCPGDNCVDVSHRPVLGIERPRSASNSSTSRCDSP